MTRRLAALACAALGFALAGPTLGHAATPLTSKWRGVYTHWYDFNEISANRSSWKHYSLAKSRTKPVTFFVQGGKASRRMILFQGKRFKLGCGGVQATLDPSLSGLTSFDRLKVSPKGHFRQTVTNYVPITLPNGETGYADTAVLVKGRFTSSRTVRGQLLAVISMGCQNWVEWAWSASSTKPRPAPKPSPHKPRPNTPGGNTKPTWGVNELGPVYGCRLIWCSYNLPPPGALPGSVPNIPLG